MRLHAGPRGFRWNLSFQRSFVVVLRGVYQLQYGFLTILTYFVHKIIAPAVQYDKISKRLFQIPALDNVNFNPRKGKFTR